MPRPKGSKNKPKGGASAPPPGKGHNSASLQQLSDDQLQALTRQHAQKRAKLIEAEKAAKAARMNFDKVIKADLGAGGLDDIKLLEQLETPEGEARIKAEMERQVRVARWAGLQVGTQGSLFEEDRRPLRDRAFEEGKRAGMDGKNATPPYDQSNEGFGAWMEGWHAGQAVNAAGFRQKAPDAEIIRETAPATGPDDFDKAADGGFEATAEPEQADTVENQPVEAPTTAPADDDLKIPDFLDRRLKKDAPAEESEGDPWPDDQQVAERAAPEPL